MGGLGREVYLGETPKTSNEDRIRVNQKNPETVSKIQFPVEKIA